MTDRGLRTKEGLPEALPDVAGAPFPDGGLALETDVNIVKMPLLNGGSRLFHRKQSYAPCTESVAIGLQGAGEAGGILRRA